MIERGGYPTAPEIKDKKNLQRSLLAPLAANIVVHFAGKGLLPEERKILKDRVQRILCGEKLVASKEGPPIYESHRSKMLWDGEEKIPESGATILIANHTRGGPFYDMGQFFDTARVVHNGRSAVEDEYIREPYFIVQRGFNHTVKIGRIKLHVPLSGFLTGQLYELVAKSINWELVSPPKFNKGGQIVNRQELPISAIRRLDSGGAMIWCPQGKHRDDLNFPQKAGDFLFRMRDKDIQLVPMRVIRKDQDLLYLLLGKPIHVQDLPVTDGGVNINDFVQAHIAPLGKNLTV